jgi:ATP:ADP antiporter, AAA family
MDPASSPGHRTAVAAATLAAGALIAQQVAGKATRDALFLSTFSVSVLPVVMIASAIVSGLAVLAFSAALQRRAPARVVPVTLAAGTVLLLLEWGLSIAQPQLAAIAVYMHMAAFGATVVSGFWSVVSERFDPHTARRVMDRIGLGASLGGVAGGVLAWSAAGLLPVPAMLAVMAVLNVACLLALSRLRASAPPSTRSTKRASPSLLTGFRLMAEVPYLRDLALLVALGAATESLLDYLLSSRAAATFSRGPGLMSFFALFHTGVGLVGLAVQLTLSRTALQGLGLAGTVALRPAVASVLALLGLADPRLWSALVARGAYGVLHNSLFRSGYELLFTPLPERRKRPTKTIVDVGCDKLGAVAGGVITLALVGLLGDASPRALFAVAALGGVAGLLVTRRLHRGYVTALEESLRSGVVRLDLADVVDSTTYLTLARTGLAMDRQEVLREVAALRQETRAPDAPGAFSDPIAQAVVSLRSGNAEEVRRVLRRSDASDQALVGHLIPLLAQNDLFLDVLRPLRRAAPRATGQLLDALLDPSAEVAVRRRIPRVLRGHLSQRAADGLLQALGDPVFEVRRQCALTLTRLTEREGALSVPRAPVFAAILQELEGGAATWSAETSGQDDGSSGRPQTAVERGLAHVFTLLSLAVEREPLQMAYLALGGEDLTLRGTALEYLENVLPENVRRALFAHLGAHVRTAPTERPREEMVRELMRAGDSVVLRREALKRMSSSDR